MGERAGKSRLGRFVDAHVPDKYGGLACAPACRCWSDGFYQLPDAHADLHDAVLRARVRVIRTGRARGTNSNRIRDLDIAISYRAVLATSFPLRARGVAMAIIDLPGMAAVSA